MKLEIITPEQIVFSGEIELVSLPGTKGLFTMLENHAPIVSSLQKGKLRYKIPQGEEVEITVGSGFVEMNNNIVSVCVEGVKK